MNTNSQRFMILCSMILNILYLPLQVAFNNITFDYFSLFKLSSDNCLSHKQVYIKIVYKCTKCTYENLILHIIFNQLD